MMSEKTFWEIIQSSIQHAKVVGTIEQDEYLIQTLEKKTLDHVVGFQLRLLKLRQNLDAKHIASIAQKLINAKQIEVLNRFKNGIIASGQEFYSKAKDDPSYLQTLYDNDLPRLRNCYYEGFSLVAPAAFYELTDYKENFDNALIKARRELEIEPSKSHLSKDEEELEM